MTKEVLVVQAGAELNTFLDHPSHELFLYPQLLVHAIGPGEGQDEPEQQVALHEMYHAGPEDRIQEQR